MTTVIFACVHNAGRSQMAAAFFNATANAIKVRALSAGTEPAAEIHQVVVKTMREVGFDLANARPTLLSDELASKADLLVTMGCAETCPSAPGLRQEDWSFPDPKGQPVETVRMIRDEIRERVKELIAREGWRKSS